MKTGLSNRDNNRLQKLDRKNRAFTSTPAEKAEAVALRTKRFNGLQS